MKDYRKTSMPSGASLLAALALLIASAAQAADTNAYQQRNLVSDGAVAADHVDPNLVNAWGIAFNPYGFVWVNNGGTGTATLYDGNGVAQPLVVRIAALDGAGKVTGIVYNGSDRFVVSKDEQSGPSRFIFATEQGTIASWSPTVDPTNAIQAVDNSATGAIYKGLALSGGGEGQLLYAADFHNKRIDVFDSSFHPAQVSGSFSDPNLPADFAPFNVQAINGDIYVTYAKQDEAGEDDVAGPGLGYVDVYDPNGNLIRRIASGGALNAPWGIALAPAGFGRFANRLLIGNFGDGRINAYSSKFGTYVGTLRQTNGEPVTIEGLWGLAFGNGLNAQPVDTLFFTAGPGDEEHGLYGRLEVAP